MPSGFDYAAPKMFEPSKTRRGVGQHPHRGFETITIALQGEVEMGLSRVAMQETATRLVLAKFNG